MGRHVIALDLGSTNLKGAVFSGTGERLADLAAPVDYSDQTPTCTEFPVAPFRDSLKTLLCDLLAAANSPPSAISTVAVTSQAQTFALIAPDGTPRTPFISWLDRRAEEEASELTRRFGGDFHQHCSFPSPIPQLQLSKLLWLRHHHPGALPRARVMPLPTYVAWQLGGLFLTDRNLGAMGGLLSLVEGDWRPDLMAACGVTPDQLPGLVEPGAIVRAETPRMPLGFPDDLAICFAGNDQTAGALGCSDYVDRPVVTLGTALVAYRQAGPEAGPYGKASCWGPFPGGGYYEMAARDEGCLALDWARDQIMPGQELESIEREARTALKAWDTDAVMFFPQRIRTDAAWSGPATIAQRALATFEGIAFSLRRLLIDELGIRQGTSIQATGGGTRRPLWLQLIADVLAGPVHHATGDPLAGAAAMAGISPRRDGQSSSGVYHPQPHVAEGLAGRYRHWCEAAEG